MSVINLTVVISELHYFKVTLDARGFSFLLFLKRKIRGGERVKSKLCKQTGLAFARITSLDLIKFSVK